MKIYIAYFFLFSFFFTNAQNNLLKDSIVSKQINLLNTEYIDFIAVKHLLYAITQNNDFVEIDYTNDKFRIIQNEITSIAKKSNNEIIFGNKNGEVFLYKKNKKIKLIDKVDAEIISILVNSNDEYVVYSNKSIYFKKNHFIPQLKTNFYGKVRSKYTGINLIQPDFIFLDKLNFLWFTFDEGEFGGNVCFFDLNKKEFIYENWLMMNDNIKYKDRNEYFKKLKETYPDKIKITEKDTIYKYPYQMNISSVTKGAAYDKENNLYISSSGGYSLYYQDRKGFNYFVNGTLVKISKKENEYYKSCFDEKFLISEKYKKAFGEPIARDLSRIDELRELRENVLTENEINVLGPIAFNKFDDNLYMYSSKGFQILKNSNCSCIKELIFKPNLKCEFHSNIDECIDLNVIKFEFISEKEILFLTRNNGIGYYNDSQIKYLR